MKTVLLLLLLNLPCYLMAQQNLSWEEKVSPKYSYKLPETEQKNNATALDRNQRPAVENPYDKLLAQREDVKANIAYYEKQAPTDKNKQYLDKYRATLVSIEKQIKEYKAPEKKEKANK